MTRAKPKPTPPRSEREYLRREMNRFASMGRGGDWLSALTHSQPRVAAKVYKMMADDGQHYAEAYSRGHPDKPLDHDPREPFLSRAIELWPEVANWTGRRRES